LEVAGIVLYTSPENTPKVVDFQALLSLESVLCTNTQILLTANITHLMHTPGAGIFAILSKKEAKLRKRGKIEREEDKFSFLKIYTEMLKCAAFWFDEQIKTVVTRIMIMCNI
jgi:hypothetical protein